MLINQYHGAFTAPRANSAICGVEEKKSPIYGAVRGVVIEADKNGAVDSGKFLGGNTSSVIEKYFISKFSKNENLPFISFF